MFKFVACLFVSIMLTSCTLEMFYDNKLKDRHFRADVSFTTDEQFYIKEYLNTLSRITDHPISVEFDLPHPETDADVHDDANQIIVRTPGRGGTWGYKPGNRVIRIGTGNGTYSAKEVAFLVAHEMGHDLGFNHVADKNSLMSTYIPVDKYGNLNEDFIWSEADEAECERVKICFASNP